MERRIRHTFDFVDRYILQVEGDGDFPSTVEILRHPDVHTFGAGSVSDMADVLVRPRRHAGQSHAVCHQSAHAHHHVPRSQHASCILHKGIAI